MATDNGNGASGSLGPIIYYTRNGKKCMRMKPAHVKNPKTKGQTHHRNKIKLAGRLIRGLRKFIDIGYQATDSDMPMNEARQYIIRNCFNNDVENTVLDYSQVMIARGELAKPEETTFTIENNSARITWKTPVRGDNTKGDDKVMIAMYSDEGSEPLAQMLSNAAYRKDGVVTVSIPIHDQPLHYWMFFYQPDYCTGESRRKISDSVYIL
jgi:hypothetical protein